MVGRPRLACQDGAVFCIMLVRGEMMIINRGFFEDLAAMSLLELTDWLESMLASATVGGDLDGVAVERLYQGFTEAMDMTPEGAAQYPEEDGARLLSNAKIYHSKIYRLAVVGTHSPRPHFFVRSQVSPPVEISRAIYGERVKAAQTANRQFAEYIQGYCDKVSKILEREDYRQGLREFIRQRSARQSYIVYRLPTRKTLLDKLDIDTVLDRLGRYKVERYIAYEQTTREADKARKEYQEVQEWEGNKAWGGLQETETFGISGSARARLFRGEDMEKPVFVRLAFFLGMEDGMAETLLRREGFSLCESFRPADTIYRNSFRIGFPITYADELCKRKGLSWLL